MGRPPVRRMLARLHRWLGLVVGLYIALIAISGIGMVFSSDFYAWEYGRDRVSLVQRDAPWAPPETWLAKAEARYGPLPHVEGYFGPRSTPMRISAPLILYTPEGREAHGVVTVDPYTGEPLARFVAEDSWAMLPLTLHMSLFLPEQIASWLLVALALLIAGFAFSGLYLWWPGRGRWRAAVRPVTPASPVALRRLHGAIGFWAAPLLLLAALTGMMLSRADLAAALAGVFGTVQAPASPTPNCGGGDIGADRALAIAKNIHPETEIASLFLPIGGAREYVVWLKPAASRLPARGNREAVIDAACGTVVSAHGPDDHAAGDYLLAYLLELHNGRILGVPGEMLIVTQGMLLTMLPAAGIALYIWRRRRTARARSSSMVSNDHAAAFDLR